MITNQKVELTSKKSDLNLAGILFVTSGIVALLLVTAAEALHPAYSIKADSISTLAATNGPTAVIGETAGFVWSIGWFLGAYFLLRKTGKNGRTIRYMIPGIGLFFAALSPGNVNVVIHTVGGLVAFIFGSIAVFSSYKFFPTPFRIISMILGIVSMFSVVIEFSGVVLYGFSFLVKTNVHFNWLNGIGNTLGVGGWERMITYPIIIWLLIFGSYLIAIGSRSKESLSL